MTSTPTSIEAHRARRVAGGNRLRLVMVLAIVAMVAAGLPHAAAAPGDMHTYSGTITGENGSALSGITVSVFCFSCGDEQVDLTGNQRRPRISRSELMGEDVTDSSGNWSVTVAKPSDRWDQPLILAWDPAGNLAPTVLNVDSEWATTTGVDSTLADGGKLSGRILADGAAPPVGVYGISIKLESLSQGKFGFLRYPLEIGDDGSFATPALPDGEVMLVLPSDLPEPYAGATCYSTPLYDLIDEAHRDFPTLATISSGQDANVDFELPKRAALSGRVTDTSGTGLGGIRIVTSPSGIASGGFAALTLDDGTYSFRRCSGSSGAFQIRFFAADGRYAPEWYDDRLNPWAGASYISGRPGAHRSDVNAQLSLAGAVSVRVVDSLGFPVPGASVSLCRSDSEDSDAIPNCLRSRTASSGSTEVVDVPADDYDVIVYPRGGGSVTASLTLPEGGREQVDVVVTAGGRISGVVTDSSGEPISGFPVIFRGNSGYSYDAVTDGDGFYVSPLMSAGDYSVSFGGARNVYPPGGIETRESIAVVDATMTTDVDARLSVGYITGTVTSGGSPVGDARVAVAPSGRSRQALSVMTALDGTYRLAAAAGEYSVHFSSAWHVAQYYDGRAELSDAGPVTVAVSAATSGIDANLTAIPRAVAPPVGTDVTGASSAQGGIPSFRSSDAITITHQGCMDGNASLRVSDIESGQSTWHGMSEEPAGSGTYVASIASASELQAVGRGHVTINMNCAGTTETVEFSIYIDPSGVVQDQNGKPVEGATVTLMRENPDTAVADFEAVADGSALMDPTVNSTNPDVTGADGQFRWDVVAGLWKVRAQAPGCHAAGDSATAYVETAELVVPPPRLGLVLELECEGTSESSLVVANGGSLSDIGTAASLVAAGLGDAVVFAESAGSLGSAVAEVVAQQQPGRVLLVGGAAALAQSVADEISRLATGVQVDRLSGADRIHTAALAAQRVLAEATDPSVVIANGWSLSDVGTAASAVAAGRADAVLYAQAGSLGDSTRDVLDEHRPTQVLIVGGARALSAEVAAAAQEAAGGTQPERLGGATRVETAAGSARHAFGQGATIAVIANGWSLPDVGIAASLAAALDGAAVLYTEQSELGDITAGLLTEHQPTHIVLVNTVEPADRALRTRIAELAPQATVTYVTAATASTQFALHPTS
ncbi:carboxypeptidase regulatory-like domain-containing protein [Candidatus Poriferisodalis sp.]|uniref:carboxypeptidase regulatory-like domain-containing protein n=1 Tax=Candidatus Poriferisodalis sp. TaxID=3101277 RepID=UPI003B5C032D